MLFLPSQAARKSGFRFPSSRTRRMGWVTRTAVEGVSLNWLSVGGGPQNQGTGA